MSKSKRLKQIVFCQAEAAGKQETVWQYSFLKIRLCQTVCDEIKQLFVKIKQLAKSERFCKLSPCLHLDAVSQKGGVQRSGIAAGVEFIACPARNR